MKIKLVVAVNGSRRVQNMQQPTPKTRGRDGVGIGDTKRDRRGTQGGGALDRFGFGADELGAGGRMMSSLNNFFS